MQEKSNISPNVNLSGAEFSPPESPIKEKEQKKSLKSRKVLMLLLLVVVGAAGYIVWQEDRKKPAPAETTNTQTEIAAINLEEVQDSSFGGEYSYYLNYPKLGEPAFDDPINQTVTGFKNDFLEDVKTAQNDSAELNIVHQVAYYNDSYLSIDLKIYERIPGQDDYDREQTYLYDRKNKKMLGLSDLFKSGHDYLAKLSSVSRGELPKILAGEYSQPVVDSGTAPDASKFREFTIDAKHNLILIFEPGAVAKASLGEVRVPVASSELESMLMQPLANQLFAIAQKSNSSSVSPADAAKNGPVPKADPSGPDCSKLKCIALTFDDGPSGLTTPQLLDTLKQHNVKATFFELGIQSQKFPAVTKRAIDEGHVVGSHTYDHKSLTGMSLSDARGEINKAADIIQASGGVRPGIVRAPYGNINNGLAQELGAPFINWSVDPDDWKDRDADTVYQRVMSHAKAGAIVLSHDIYQSTVDAYKRIIPDLQAQGYTLVTVPQLLNFGNDVTDKVYFNR